MLGQGRRRRPPAASHQPFAGLQVSQGPEGLSVFGLPVVIVCDAAAAADLEEGSGLIAVGGDGDNLTDRFDARLLLDPISLAASARRRPQGPGDAAAAEDAALAAEGTSREVLDHERYRDLDPAREEELQHGRLLPPAGRMYFDADAGEEPPGGGRRYVGALPPPAQPPPSRGFGAVPFDYGGGRVAHDGQYAAVGFSYADGRTPLAEREEQPQPGAPQRQQQAEQPAAAEEPFVPPLLIPKRLRGHQPATQRHYKIIRQTAGFVREGGQQLEVLLRVKQAADPTFAFLEPSNRLHPFYRHVRLHPSEPWLLESDPSDIAEINAAPGAQAQPPPTLAAPSGSTADPQQQQQRQQQDGESRGGGSGEEEEGPEFGPALPPQSALQLLGQYGSSWQQANAHGHAPAQQLAEEPPPERGGNLATAAAAAADGQPGAAPADVPPDTWAIMAKLARFIQKNGATFESVVRAREARNPRFAFLHHTHSHHRHYRGLLAEALGPAEADALLAAAAEAAEEAEQRRLVAVMVGAAVAAAIASAEVEAAAAAKAAAPPVWHYQAPAVAAAQPAAPTPAASRSSGEAAALPGGVPPPWLLAKKGAAGAAAVKVKANPAIAAVVPRPHDAAAPADAPAADACQQALGPPEEGQQDAQPTAEAAAAERAAEERAAAQHEAELEEQRKAERRRRARKLLAQRQQQAALEADQRRQRQLAEIAQHRRAFLGDDSAAGQAAAPAAAPAKEAVEPLEDLALRLRMRRAASNNALAGGAAPPAAGQAPRPEEALARHRAAFAADGEPAAGAEATPTADAPFLPAVPPSRPAAPVGAAPSNLQRIRERIAAAKGAAAADTASGEAPQAVQPAAAAQPAASDQRRSRKAASSSGSDAVGSDRDGKRPSRSRSRRSKRRQRSGSRSRSRKRSERRPRDTSRSCSRDRSKRKRSRERQRSKHGRGRSGSPSRPSARCK